MAPALRVPVSVNMQQFEQQMGQLGNVTTRVVKTMRNEFIKLNAEIAVEGVKGLALFSKEIIKISYQTGLLGSSFRNLARVALPIGIIYGTFKAMSEITEFARLKIEEFVKIQEKAAAIGVSTDFFQRWTKGAETLKIKVEEATAILEKFADAARNKLGGSDLQKRIVELQEAGNLKGVSTKGFEGAIGNTEKLEAANKIITQMLDKGERLAALDLAEKMGGRQLADNLAADSGYLTQMLATARQIEATKLVSQDDINRAIDLHNRLEEARKLLAEKWVPLQRQLIKLGLDYNESWVNFYANMATVVALATSLFGIFDKIGAKLNSFGSSPFWTKMTEVTGKLGLNSPTPPGAEFGPFKKDLSPAEQALASGLKNPALIKDAMRQATEIQTKVLGDISKPTGVPKPTAAEAKSAYETQNEQIEKHIALMNADAAAVGLGAGAQEQLRTEAKLYEALLKDGITDTEKFAEVIHAMGERAGQSADSLAKANHQLQQINQLGQTIGSSLSTAFADAVLEGKKLNEVMSQLLKTLARAAINWAIMAPFQAGPGGGASLFAGLFGAGKASGTDYAQGGMTLVGEQGRELVNLPRGSQVIPNDALRSGMGGGGTVVYSPAIDARGASVEAVARLAQIMEQDRAMFASRTIATIQQARRGRVAGL